MAARYSGAAILVALATWLCVTSPATAASADDKVFVIGNYPVEARAADAVTAKEKAIAEGQQAAFRSLLKRLVPVTAYSRLSELRDTKVGDLVAGFSVRSERNSSTEYIASYDFTFQADAVRNILEAEGIPFLDRQAEPLTLILAYRAPAGAEAPSEAFSDARGSDTWLYAWKALDLSNALTPIALKPLKKETPPDAIQAVLDGDPSAMRALAADYQASLAVVALLEPEAGVGRMRVTLAGRDAAGAFSLARSYRLSSGDLAYTSEAAAVVSLGIIEGRWKAVAARSDSGHGRPGLAAAVPAASGLRIAVEFNNMTQWQVISRQLAQTPNVSDLEVEGLSARGARLSLRYPGGPERLAAALAEYGLTLRATGGGGWLLTAR
jgi:hypothetical protein